MNRRELLLLATWASIAASEVVAQPTASVRRIGLLTVEDIFSAQRDSIMAALAEHGWVEGRNLYLVARSAGGDRKRLRAAAVELVRLDVEVIVGIGTEACQEAKAATLRVPIVMYGVGEPVATGLVSSLARPGGNVTGVSYAQRDQAVKRIDALREMLPAGSGIGFLTNLTNPVARLVREIQEETCRAVGLTAIHVDVAKNEEIVPALTEIARRSARVLVVPSDPFFATPANWGVVYDAARRLGLPMVLTVPADREGVILGFSVDWDELDRRVASFVDRILRGASPATLPVELPSRFSLSINLRTARTAGISVPQSLLLRADQVYR